MERRTKFNWKRKITKTLTPELKALATTVNYGGNPEHKRNPGDFGLKQLLHPRAKKSLCDNVQIFTKQEAIRLLRAGIINGLVSEQTRNGFPQNIWMVTDNGSALEAELENQEQGTYHGYPMPDNDPFITMVKDHWIKIGNPIK